MYYNQLKVTMPSLFAILDFRYLSNPEIDTSIHSLAVNLIFLSQQMIIPSHTIVCDVLYKITDAPWRNKKGRIRRPVVGHFICQTASGRPPPHPA